MLLAIGIGFRGSQIEWHPLKNQLLVSDSDLQNIIIMSTLIGKAIFLDFQTIKKVGVN